MVKLGSSEIVGMPVPPPQNNVKTPPRRTRIAKKSVVVETHKEVKARTHTGGVSYRGSGGAGNEYLPTGSKIGNIYAYVRRSAEDRTHRPLAAQIDSIDRYAAEVLNSRIHTYFGDNGVSGSTAPEKRDGMLAMFAALKEATKTGRVHIIAYDASRLARSVYIGSRVRTLLEDIGATLHLSQSRMKVEGANADLFFGINLQLAASERTATIARVRASLRARPDWDPRKSLGWQFKGAGENPEEIPTEQAMLNDIQTMYEGSDKTVTEIAAAMQLKHGNRRSRGKDTTKTEAWTGGEISFLANKHKWVWGGPQSFKDLEIELAQEKQNTVDEMFESRRGKIYDGVRINRPMIARAACKYTDHRQSAINLARSLLRNETHSNDDIIERLNEHVPRTVSGQIKSVAWPRQTGWRIIREAARLNELEARQGEAKPVVLERQVGAQQVVAEAVVEKGSAT